MQLSNIQLDCGYYIRRKLSVKRYQWFRRTNARQESVLIYLTFYGLLITILERKIAPANITGFYMRFVKHPAIQMDINFNTAIQWSTIWALQLALQLQMDQCSHHLYAEGYRITRSWSLRWACVYMELYSVHTQVSHQDRTPLVQASFHDSGLTLRHLGNVSWNFKFTCRHPCMNTEALW